MILLHASLDGGQLLVWGETPAETRKRPGRKLPRSAAASPFPFDAGADRLAAALALVAPDGRRALEKEAPAFVWLPTQDGRPVPSSPLIAAPPAGGAAPVLTAWAVTAFRLTPSVAVDLLATCVNRETLAPGVLIGSTLAFWVAALRFAGALVSREQFVPSMRNVGPDWFAGWQPVLAGSERERFSQLARAMPPACRALNWSAETPPDRPAAAVLEAFLETAVDALVRAGQDRPVSLTVRRRRSPQPRPTFDSLHDQWLHALRSPDGGLTGRATELADLARQVAAWQRPVLGTAVAPFRLCFRLEEPPAENGEPAPARPWHVRYLLQARDDPSLLLPAADSWQPAGRVATVFQQRGFAPREFLLTALGQAAGLCPPVEASLRKAAPGGFDLDATGAHTFLTETAWSLEQAGFGVLLPAWWTPKGSRQRLAVRAKVKTPAMQGGSGLTLEELVKFDWRVALGDVELSLDELRLLAKLKTPLVRVRGQWVEIRPEELQAVLALWERRAAGQASVREIVQMALGAAEAPGGVPVSGVEATGWLGDLLDRLQGQAVLTDLPPPAGLHGTLRPYQIRGYSWLAFLQQWGLGACLADDMGLGKTVQTLALIERDWEGSNRKPTLLVCPTSVLGNWQREAQRFTPELPVLLHHGVKRAKGSKFAQQARAHALVLTSYALLHRDQALLQDVDWAGVVLDEAQNIKNPVTKQAQAARALKGGYRAALTGTPVENHVGDLWSIFQFLNPGFLGSQADFRRRFFLPIQAGHDPEAAERLKRLTGPFVLRRLKTDKSVVSDLPEKVEMKVFATLTKEQASLYAAVVEETNKALKDAEGIQRKGLVLATLLKLKQVCNHPAHFLGDGSALADRSGKLARLTELLEEILPVGDRLLLFTQFKEMGELLIRYLQDTFGREVLFLHGGVPRKERDRLVERFQQEADGPRIFVLSLKAGGIGLNLTAANHVVHFDRWWNPAVENQATDRAFRIGQVRNVLVHKFVCSGTLEEKIDEMIERKQVVAGRVVGTGEGWLTELSNEQLKELFALRKEALGD
jgi:SNF2 family DNA or RNA helicase